MKIDIAPQSYSPQYQVDISRDFSSLSRHLSGKRVAVIADSNTRQFFYNDLGHELFTIPAGEESKTREVKERLENQLLDKGFNRTCTILALGGGVVLDVAAFVASTFCRGVPLIMAPTSLLAMCDAAIGGKTAVNVAQGKNMIGTIYHPEAIFINISTLLTLPEEELKNGLVEAIKHGLIYNAEYFCFLEQNVAAIKNLHAPAIETLISESIRIKKAIIEADTYERGLRRILNFGHTIGHAIEVATNYRVSHGKAVATGIIEEMLLSKLSIERVSLLFKAYGIETIDNLPDLYDAMKHDKKALSQTPRFVQLEKIGKCLSFDGEYCQEVVMSPSGFWQ